jgi:hypothetical protein
MFHKLSEIDWKKALKVLGGIAIFWGSIAILIPAHVNTWVLAVLAGLTGAFTYWMNASKGA